mmetsp:Transcript_65176/g.147000  ORF Transcript_65176/g.147000 Transcript_65176/m.147000 type:complete len:439 (+) Transcript_65176:402-1718(+)
MQAGVNWWFQINEADRVAVEPIARLRKARRVPAADAGGAAPRVLPPGPPRAHGALLPGPLVHAPQGKPLPELDVVRPRPAPKSRQVVGPARVARRRRHPRGARELSRGEAEEAAPRARGGQHPHAPRRARVSQGAHHRPGGPRTAACFLGTPRARGGRGGRGGWRPRAQARPAKLALESAWHLIQKCAQGANLRRGRRSAVCRPAPRPQSKPAEEACRGRVPPAALGAAPWAHDQEEALGRRSPQGPVGASGPGVVPDLPGIRDLRDAAPLRACRPEPRVDEVPPHAAQPGDRLGRGRVHRRHVAERHEIGAGGQGLPDVHRAAPLLVPNSPEARRRLEQLRVVLADQRRRLGGRRRRHERAVAEEDLRRRRAHGAPDAEHARPRPAPDRPHVLPGSAPTAAFLEAPRARGGRRGGRLPRAQARPAKLAIESTRLIVQ